MHAPRKTSFAEKIMRQRYFFFAVLLHVVVFLMLSTVVLFKAVTAREDFESAYVAGDPGGGEAPPPPPPASTSETVPVPTQNTAMASNNEVFNVDTPTPDAPPIPVPNIQAPTPTVDKSIASASAPKAIDKAASFNARADGIRNMMKGWGRGGSGGGSGNGKGFGNGGRNTVAEFKCYIAQYAQGDWSTTLEIVDGKIKRGSLINLLYSVQENSRGKIRANVVPVPLKLSSSEIFDIKPPFIFFTGHKDFVLTDTEIQNLRKYLIQGGAIWGDNGLAGRGSRFDVAFRREMKRVLPSEDQQFYPLPDDHPIFTKSFNDLKGVPPGMNYYQEPIEGINMDDCLAVVYTLNDYSDMYRMAFKPNTIEPDLQDAPDKARVTPWNIWIYHDVYYRNFTPEGCKASFDLGLNIIVHLLTRFDDKLLLAP
jgi:hypothetical protein